MRASARHRARNTSKTSYRRSIVSSRLVTNVLVWSSPARATRLSSVFFRRLSRDCWVRRAIRGRRGTGWGVRGGGGGARGGGVGRGVWGGGGGRGRPDAPRK